MVEICAKAAIGNPEDIGDCPYTQRILLILEEKEVPYQLNLINLDDKPQWFIDQNPSEDLPVMKDEQGNWVSDTDAILGMINAQYPEPSLETPEEFSRVGSNLLPILITHVESKDPDDGTQQAVLDELNALNDHFRENGPYIAGENVTHADLRLVPILYHASTVLSHFKKWDIPEDLTHLKNYIELMLSRPSVCKTSPDEPYIIAGWEQDILND